MITQDNAKDIAAKFGRHDDSECDMTSGGNHKIAEVFFRGVLAFSFGIRHDKKASHDYIPRQMGLSVSQTTAFANCDLSVEEWVPFARAKDLIPPEPPVGVDGVIANGSIVNVEGGPKNATIMFRNQKANTYGCSWMGETGFQIGEFSADEISVSDK